MNFFQENKTHFIAILVFVIAIGIYFLPAFQGKVIDQDDIKNGVAKAKEINDYRDETGEEALWTNSMFGGMPALQMNTKYTSVLNFFEDITKAWLPQHTGLIFTLILGFYFLLVSQKVDPLISIIGALAFGFSAFFIIGYGAGHNAKIRTIGYIAPVIMGILLTYSNKRLAGFAITTIAVGLSVWANHLQITYYTIFIILTIAIVELIDAVKKKETKPFIISSAILVLAAIFAIGPATGKLWAVYDYNQESIRGGKSELSSKESSAGGVDFDYAMAWSYNGAEMFNLIIPYFTGGGIKHSYENTKTYETFSRTAGKDQADGLTKSYMYWGEQSLVHGAFYIGAVVFFLFVLGLFIVKGKIRSWIIVITLLGIALGLGKNFRGFNEFLFDNLPMFNKFRVPSMALTLVFFTVPLLGFLALGKVVRGDMNKEELKKKLLMSLYVAGGICLLFIVLGSSLFDFEGLRDEGLRKQLLGAGYGQGQADSVIDDLVSDRISLMRNSAIKTLVIIGISFGLIWLYIKQTLNKLVFTVLLGALVVGDLWSFDYAHVNKENFLTKRKYDAFFDPTASDQLILRDPSPSYRVVDLNTGFTSDAYTSYHHKSIKGYHGAKLIKFQELIENHLAQEENQVKTTINQVAKQASNQAQLNQLMSEGMLNTNSLNMLNTKYLIANDNGGVITNSNALGNAWFVNTVKVVQSADEEMAQLSSFNPADEVLVDKRYTDYTGKTSYNKGASTIELSEYSPRRLTYKANVKGGEQFAVFSEIYYEGGSGEDWDVTIDGEKADHTRVNYLLRGMIIPEGEHTILFEFNPRSYIAGAKISLVFSALMLLVIGFTIYKSVKGQKQTEEKKEAKEG